MRPPLLAAALCLAPSVAAAAPLTVGVDLGVVQSKTDSEGEGDQSIGLYGRLGVTSHLSLQLSLADVATDETDLDLRMVTASLVVDLGSSGRFVPIAIAGFGLDSASWSYGGETTAHRLEGGIGLEYRAANGLTIGADLRIGERTLDQEGVVYTDAPPELTYCEYSGECTDPVREVTSTLAEGEYRSARVSVGLRF